MEQPSISPDLAHRIELRARHHEHVAARWRRLLHMLGGASMTWERVRLTLPEDAERLTDELPHPRFDVRGWLVRIPDGLSSRFPLPYAEYHFITTEGVNVGVPMSFVDEVRGQPADARAQRLIQAYDITNLLWVEAIAGSHGDGRHHTGHAETARRHLGVWTRFVDGEIGFDEAVAETARLGPLPNPTVY